jgi:Got1/Sft2-like family
MSADPAEASFRSQLSGFRWAQGRTDDSRGSNGTSTGGPASYLSTLGSSISGYVPLRSNERTNEEEAYLSLSRWERFLGFLACLGGSAICFFFSFLFLAPPIVRPRKFALAFSLGSLLFMVGFSILSGPIAHLKHILSKERLPFSVAYFGSLALTMYFALGPRWTLPALIAAIVQICAILAYVAAYFPGGITTLRYGGSMILRGGASLLPI